MPAARAGVHGEHRVAQRLAQLQLAALVCSPALPTLNQPGNDLRLEYVVGGPVLGPSPPSTSSHGRCRRLFVISEAHTTGLDNITRLDGQTVRLLHPPDDLIFIEA